MASSSESSSGDEDEILSLISRNAKAKIKLMAPAVLGSDDHQSSSLHGSSSPPSSSRGKQGANNEGSANGRITRGDLNRLRLSGSDDLDDDFELDLPPIFKTDAIENERLLHNHDRLDRDLRESNNKMKLEYQQLVAVKTAILSELNDNGSVFEYSPSKERHRTLIESLTKKSLHSQSEFAVKRHFYLFGNVYHLNHDLDCFSDIRSFDYIQSTLALATYTDESIDALLQHVFKGNLKSLLDYALLKVYDLNVLDKLAKYFARYSTPIKTHDNPGALFLEYIKALGADAQVIDSLSLRCLERDNDDPLIPLKIIQYSTHTTLLLLRLSLVFCYFILSDTPGHHESINDDYFIGVFHLTAADFNLNKHDSNALVNSFIKPVFKKIAVRAWSRSAQSKDAIADLLGPQLSVWSSSWHHLYKAYLYPQPRKIISDTKPIELRYNFLRLLHQAFVDDPDEPLLVHVLVAMLIQSATGASDPDRLQRKIVKLGGPQIMTRTMLELGPTINLSVPLKKVTRTISELRIPRLIDDFERQDYTATNKIYHIYYSLLTVNLQLQKTFSKNYNCEKTRAQYAKIKKDNHMNITKLATTTNKALEDAHHTLSYSLRLSSKSNEYHDKDIVVGMITDIYNVLSYLHNVISKDLRLVRHDIFYDQK